MPRMRRTVPLGSSRATTDGSRRKDRIAAMEVMGPLMSMPPPLPTGQHPHRAGCSGGSLAGPSDASAVADQLGQAPGLGGPLGGERRPGGGGLRVEPVRPVEGDGEDGAVAGRPHPPVPVGTGHASSPPAPVDRVPAGAPSPAPL